MEILACILIADFLTGVVHWIEDTYGVPSWPLLGASIIEPNILHHKDQVDFTKGGMLYRNYQVWGFVAASIAIVYLTGWLTWQVTLTAVVASMGNEIHAWAHKRPRSRIIRLMQEMKLVCSPEQHAKHHRPPYDTNFCTVTNWLNPVLDAVCFWRGLEWTLDKVGFRVQRMSVARRGY